MGNPLTEIMTVELEYLSLRDEFLSVAQIHVNGNIFNVLKEYYAQCVNSNRKLSQIKDLRTLLKVLEKRDALNSTNIEPLLYISNFLNDLHMRSKLERYKNYLKHMQYPSLYNMYQEFNENKNKSEVSNVPESSTSQAEISKEHETQSTFQMHKKYRSNCFEQETELQQILLTHISERIGRSWRDTARYLGIPEYQIDAIQSKHALDLKEQSYEALKLYMNQYSNNNWKLNLIRALEKARRRDLKELVEKLILEMNKQSSVSGKN